MGATIVAELSLNSANANWACASVNATAANANWYSLSSKAAAATMPRVPSFFVLFRFARAISSSTFRLARAALAASVLAQAAGILFAVPLDIKIHEGLIFSNRDKRTLLDKLLDLVNNLKLDEPCYLVADAYYASGKMVKGTLAQGHDLVTRAKSNCVAYHPAPAARGKRAPGRPRRYGKKQKLWNLFRRTSTFTEIPSPVYDEKGVMIRVRCCDLLWRSFGSWLRTIRSGVAPSEMVVTMALRNTLSEFLLVFSGSNIMAKFIEQRLDRSRA
ncbi:MAG: transposase, partial [Sulfitobacter sp.]|nr:transposase [Sulfitobacter sp.]